MEVTTAPFGLIWCVPARTPRLEYVLQVLLGEWLKLPYAIIPASEWPQPIPTGWRVLAYGTACPEADLHIPFSGFLLREGTDFVLPPWDEKGFFPGVGDFGWDLPAMAFYVLTLYPLYRWPYGYDQWGLYAWHKAPFYTAPFWQEPFLLLRLYELLDRLGIRWPRPAFHWEIGWDIDHLYAWKGRGGLRWWIGGLRRKDLFLRLKTRLGRHPDPYDTIHAITATFSPAHSRFFFLLSQRHKRDSLIAPTHPALRQAIQKLYQKGYAIGIHPSFLSREKPRYFFKEKALLERYLGGKPVTESRQHYLRFYWPDLAEVLTQAGIERDYTMAFPERSGFLLGTTLPVPVYHVGWERRVSLTLIGPALMDQVYLQREDFLGLREEIQRLVQVVQKAGGLLHLLWHNSTWWYLPKEVLPTSAGGLPEHEETQRTQDQ